MSITDIDAEVYDRLVAEPSDNKLLENLLAYHLYQETKIRLITRYYNYHRDMPSDDFMRDVLVKDEIIDDFRVKAQSRLTDQILKETETSEKKASFISKVIDEVILSISSNTVIAVLSFIIVQAAISYGIIKYLPSLFRSIPSLKDLICK